MTVLSINSELKPGPWQIKESQEGHGSLRCFRPVLEIKDSSLTRITSRRFGELFIRQTSEVNSFRRFEVPVSVVSEDGNLQGICLDRSHVDLEIPRAVYVPDQDAILKALKPYLELIDSLAEKSTPQQKDLVWELVREGQVIRTFSRVAARLRRSRARDQPPIELIVRLALRITKIVEDIATNPRLILERFRESLPLHQLREMDDRCVDWLARQPGRTIAQKAGHRRHVMGVIRRESANTIENRVVKMLLQECRILSREYVETYDELFPDHLRVRSVKRFGLLCSRLLRETFLGSLPDLHGIPRPNYALLNESRYRIIWKAYLQVMRREDRLSNIRLWHQRTWSEAWQLSMWEQLDQYCGRSPARRAQLQLFDQPDRGNFIAATSRPSPWITPGGIRWDWIPGECLSDSYLPRDLQDLSVFDPDWVLSCEGNCRKVLGWTVAGISADELLKEVDFSSLAEQAEKINPAESYQLAIIAGDSSVQKVERISSHQGSKIEIGIWSWPLQVTRYAYDAGEAIALWLNHA